MQKYCIYGQEHIRIGLKRIGQKLSDLTNALSNKTVTPVNHGFSDVKINAKSTTPKIFEPNSNTAA